MFACFCSSELKASKKMHLGFSCSVGNKNDESYCLRSVLKESKTTFMNRHFPEKTRIKI